jgi:hypothetical protein
MPRHFTPATANEALDEIRPLVEELVEHRREQHRIGAEREELARKIAGNGGGIEAQDLADLEAASEQERIGVVRCVNAIHERGAIVKSPDDGLVDFPAQREGEEILLCWRLGEDEVAYWHSLEEGFAGRKPIEPE